MVFQNEINTAEDVLVSKKKLLIEIQNYKNRSRSNQTSPSDLNESEMLSLICNAPGEGDVLISAVWVKIRMEKGELRASCSRCGHDRVRDTVMGKISENFCKNCGAKISRPY